MKDQRDLPALSNTPLGLILWPMIVCWFWTEDGMLLMKCWMEADQSCGASQASSVGTTVDASGKDRPVPGLKTCIQVISAPI